MRRQLIIMMALIILAADQAAAYDLSQHQWRHRLLFLKELCERPETEACRCWKTSAFPRVSLNDSSSRSSPASFSSPSCRIQPHLRVRLPRLRTRGHGLARPRHGDNPCTARRQASARVDPTPGARSPASGPTSGVGFRRAAAGAFSGDRDRRTVGNATAGARCRPRDTRYDLLLFLRRAAAAPGGQSGTQRPRSWADQQPAGAKQPLRLLRPCWPTPGDGESPGYPE